MDERDTPDLPPGTTINGLAVERLENAGGFGTVYRVRDPLTGTLFAFKFIPLHLAEASAGREPSITTLLRHQNLARQMGFGYWPLAEPRFMWMQLQYIQGRQLDVWAREENPDACAVAGKVRGLARGLAVAHDLGIVHRDIKEPNILVRDSDGEPVLVDFGAARREGQATLTQGLFPPGTAHYRSPEAWRFAQQNMDTPGAHYRPGKADDLYAVGVVLYRQLTGRFPFLVTDEPGSILAIIHHVPLPPHIINPRVPKALSAVCMKLLEKKPEDRYPSTLALHDVLDELLSHADASWKVP